MKFNEVINAKIAEMGHVWEVTADRASVPVLLTPAAEEGADAWELWLKGSRHPDWQIVARGLTKAEASAIQSEVPDGLNPTPEVVACDFYVRDGRARGWNRSQVVRPGGPRRTL
jgi:hypothetical protein